MGLIQRAIEAEGISTISISLNRTITEKVNPPRALRVSFPLGHPLGYPFDKALQRQILGEMVKGLREITEPGTIVNLPETRRLPPKKCLICRI